MLGEDFNNPYILLTPGPLSTSKTVRQAMCYDSCTWDNDYKSVVTGIRSKLLDISGCNEDQYTTVLMQGSGTFGVEATLGSSINPAKHKILILENGVYGRRMAEIAKILKLPFAVYSVAEGETYDPHKLEEIILNYPMITHVAVVHCETTTGILNNLAEVAKIVKLNHKYLIVDAMSTFGGVEFDITKLGIDFCISSANKCIQGIPGFSFVICRKDILQELCENNEKSLSLSLYGQWLEMEKDAGKWRYTSPTHAVIAFEQAIKELEQEGGVRARQKRYTENQRSLVAGMLENGFKTYIKKELQSPIITSFLYPTNFPFKFEEFYTFLKQRGFVIYPGKVSDAETFRIGTIGHLFPNDIKRFLNFVTEYTNMCYTPAHAET